MGVQERENVIPAVTYDLSNQGTLEFLLYFTRVLKKLQIHGTKVS